MLESMKLETEVIIFENSMSEPVVKGSLDVTREMGMSCMAPTVRSRLMSTESNKEHVDQPFKHFDDLGGLW